MRVYRNANRRDKYHIAHENWVNTGKAICGANIAKPAYGWDDVSKAYFPLNHLLCKHCAKILATTK